MRAFVTHRRWAPFLLLTGLLVFAAGQAHAQDPARPWDHYRVYDVFNPNPFPVPPVYLVDQFTSWQHQVLRLVCFMNPTEKRRPTHSSPIHDPRLHYTWWEISPAPGNIPVLAINQFGPQPLRVVDARYLLNPALKNEPPTLPLPVANHYKCYDCVGDPVNQSVILMDQFGNRDAFVTFPRYLCNPTYKTTRDGTPYPIVDPEQHLVCYEIDPRPEIYSAVITDQFVRDLPVELGPDKLLCVPSEKQLPTPTTPSTWGRLKSLYR